MGRTYNRAFYTVGAPWENAKLWLSGSQREKIEIYDALTRTFLEEKTDRKAGFARVHPLEFEAPSPLDLALALGRARRG